MDAIVELKSVSKHYSLPGGGSVQILEDINIQVRPGDIIALLGSSGSGKSTILRILAGLTSPSSGIVHALGEPLQGINQSISLVFQSFALYPWLTVYENVELGLLARQLPQAQREAEISSILEVIGLRGYEKSLPKELSGGMRQRVGFARAIVANPKILCMDEPFSALDVLTAENLRSEIMRLWTDKVTAIQSIFCVTHNIEEAVYFANRIIILGAKPGHIKKEIENTLAYPRDFKSKPFEEMVDYVYDSITHIDLPDIVERAPEPQESRTYRKRPIESLPFVAVGEIIGLIGLVVKQDEEVNIFELAAEAGKEFGEIIGIVKCAEILGFVETPKQEIRVTKLGSEFAGAEKRRQREIFASCIMKLRLFEIIFDIIRSQERFPSQLVKDQLTLMLPYDSSDKVLSTVIEWARFADLIEYDDMFESLLVKPPKPPPQGAS